MEKYLINPNQKIGRIDRNIYGNFSEHLGRCIYEGLYVGEDSPIPNVNGMRKDVVDALKEIGLPVLRWPGGCFADEYHWKDGIGPKESRKKMINTHWGGVVEDNSFGTHEFFELCRQIGCAPYVNGNVGSGTVAEMSEWVEYMTFEGVSPMAELRRENGREAPWDLKFFAVGNENWGCGGNMTAEFYADQYKRYSTYVRNYNGAKKVSKIACGPSDGDYHWTEVLMKNAAGYMDGLSLHHYSFSGGLAAEFDGEGYYTLLDRAYLMEELVTRHSEIMNRYDPEKRVSLVVDEWGTWHNVEPGTNPGFLYQQNTVRDAIVAGITLNIFNKHCDRVRMANIAQAINVLQSVALTDGEDMLLTPTYFVFRLFREHQDSTLLGSFITTGPASAGNAVPKLIESASLSADGSIVSTVVNTSLSESAEIDCQIADFSVSEVKGEVLGGDPHGLNTFENKNAVGIEALDGISLKADGFKAVVPPCSVVRFTVK